MKHLYLIIAGISLLCAQAKAAETSDEWTLLGTGILTDGWVTPGILKPASMLDPADHTFEVQVYESTEKAGVYKLQSPWTSDKFPYLDYNANTTPCDIVIDASNPEFVKIDPQVSGFVHKEPTSKDYSDPFYIGTSGCYYIAEEGYTEADVIKYGFAATLTDGVITIPHPCHGSATSGANFGFNWSPDYNTVITLPKKPIVENNWKLLGTGILTDGWVTPGILKPASMLDPADHTFEVQVYESTEKAGVYKLQSPWTSDKFPYLDYNANTTPCDIVIDASNPEFVKIDPQVSGFVHKEPTSKDYSDPFYIGTSGCYYIAEEGYTEADVIKYGFAATMADGVITIPHPCHGSAASGANFGFNWSPDYNTVITLPKEEPVQTWTAAGELTFVDGFIYPGYLGDPEGHGWKLTYETNPDRPGCYRIPNPYRADDCPLLDFNRNTQNAYVTIDASDPECVLIIPQYSGFTDLYEGETYNFYIGNDAGYLNYAEGWSVDHLKEYLPQRLDKMEDGIITINKPLFGPHVVGFGVQWTDPVSGELISYPAKFIFPGAGASTADAFLTDEDTPAEWYNLNGMKVDCPTQNGIYIKVQGGKASKILVK